MVSFRPVASFFSALTSRFTENTAASRLPAQLADSFEHSRLDPLTAYARMHELGAREAHLSRDEAIELCNLNEAERLQGAIERGMLKDEDVEAAARLTHLRQAFATHPPEEFFPINSPVHFSRPASPRLQNSPGHNPGSGPSNLTPGLSGLYPETPTISPQLSEVDVTANMPCAFPHSPPEQTSPASSSAGEPSFFSRLFNPGRENAGTSAVGGHFNPVRAEDLFGANPRYVTMEQGYSATCHTLAPVHAILRHPQARQILNQLNIGFNAERGVYRVGLPNREPIEIPLTELNEVRTRVQSSHIGVALLETLFLRASQARSDLYNSATHALTTLFGESHRGGPGVIPHAANYVPLEESLNRGMYDARNRVADIWVAAPQHISQTPGRAAGSYSTGGHYYGVSLTPDRQTLQVFNPVTPPAESGIPKIYHLPPVAEALHLNAYNQSFIPELIQIQL